MILLVLLVVAIVVASQFQLTSLSSPDSQPVDSGGSAGNGKDLVGVSTATDTGPSENQPVGAGGATTESAGELDADDVERLIHENVNEERSQRDLQPLSYDPELEEIAKYHSEDMAENGYFSHDSPSGEEMSDRYDKFGYDCRASAGGNRYYTGAENIAYTYYEERISGGIYHDSPVDVAEGVVKQWMESPGHRRNILLEEWNNEGIGVYIKEVPEGTRVYVTQNFC